MDKHTLDELRAELASVRRRLDMLDARIDAADANALPATPAPSQHNKQDHTHEHPPPTPHTPSQAPNQEPDQHPDQSQAPAPPSPETAQPTSNPTLEALVHARARAHASAQNTALSAAPSTAPSTGQPATSIDGRAAESPPPAQPAPKPTRPRGMSHFEWLVGAKGIVLLGVLILVIAAGLFLKEAWDRGWIATVPDWLRCLVGGAFGTALIIVGEIIRRRINPLASTGLSAAGIAIVYGSILAAAQLYNLLPLPIAFTLLALTTLLGIALGALSSRVMLAAFSLIGAFLVPIVIGSDQPSPVAMPAYLIALLTLGLGLAAWRGPSFAIIRRIAWWGTALLGSLWIWSIHEASPTAALVFIAAVWLMTIAELIASARFFHWLRPNRLWPETATHGITRNDIEGTIELDINALLRPEARWLNSIFGVTAWTAIAAGFVVTQHAPQFDWLVPMTLAAASILIIIACSPNRPRPHPRHWVSAATPMSALASAMALNAAALIALTLATGLVGPIQVVAWGLIGLAAVAFGWSVRFHAANLLGLAFIAIGTARLVAFDLPDATGLVEAPATSELARILGIAITAWTWQMALIAACITAAAALQRREQLRQILDVAALAAGAACAFGPGSATISMGAAWCLLALPAAWIAVRSTRPALRFAAPALLAIGSITTALAGLQDANTANNTPILGNLGLAWSNWSWTMLLVAACWCAIARLLASNIEQRSIAALLAIGAVTLAILGDATPMPTAVLAWAILYAATAVLGTRLPHWRITELAIGFAFANALAWIGTIWHEGWTTPDALPIFHTLFIAGTITTATLAGGAWLLSRANRHADTPLPDATLALQRAAYAGTGAMALIITSLEVMHITERFVPEETAAQSAALSIWWSLFAVGTIALGILKANRIIRWAGLILIAVAAAKVLLIDLATLTPMWRIVGSAAVGMILLAAGIAYAWLMRESNDEPRPPTHEPEQPDAPRDAAQTSPPEQTH